ncbi:MAG: hypothetical protein Q8M40_03430 [Legionella sp.]|nr:hypothetical protein [Legionella sp.]
MRINVIAGVFLTALGSQYAVATSLNHYDLEKTIFDTSHELSQIAEENKTDLCSGDVLIAAAYMESSGAKLQRHQIGRALVSMTYGHNELKEISNVRSYCAHFSLQVKPFLEKVNVMKRELEHIALSEQNKTSD